jgi:cupin fold WbuC family metalloprotein
MESSQTLTLIDDLQLDELTREAGLSSRKRSHRLLHAGVDDPVQRLLIGAQPGTYVRPHQHTEQWEMLTLLRGSLDVLIMDQNTRLLQRHNINGSSRLVVIPMSAWHSCVVRESDTVVLEVKPGPSRPNEFGPWAPEEGAASVPSFVDWLRDVKLGETWHGSTS